MTNLNSVVLVGNIVRDLDEQSFGYVANGNARANICIAVNRAKKVGDNWQDDTSYFDITIWGKTAENLKPYLIKGQKIAVEGYLKQDRWEKDGQKFSRVGIVANNVELCGNRSGNNNQGNSGGQNVQQNQAVNNNYQQQSFDNGGMSYQEDIPF